jgi:hypothetical protein
MRPRRFAAVAILATLAAACGPGGTPESQVRALVTRGEEAAEARDLSGLMDLVSPAYQDGQGGGREDLKQYLRGYLVTHQSIHLLTRVDSIAFPYRDMARVRLTLGTLGREAAGTPVFDLAGDVYDVELELQLDDGEWRVTRARWHPAADRNQGAALPGRTDTRPS